MKCRILFVPILLALLCLCLPGCKPGGLNVVVHNDLNENIFDVVVFYGSGSFTVKRMEPGSTHHTIINPLHPGKFDVRFNDKGGHMHAPFIGPNVAFGFEGELNIHIENDYKVRYDGQLMPTPESNKQPTRDPKDN